MTIQELIQAYYIKESKESEDISIEIRGDIAIIDAYGSIIAVIVKDIFIYDIDRDIAQLKLLAEEMLSRGLAVVGMPYEKFYSIVSFITDNYDKINSIYLNYPNVMFEVRM